jgi:hypothetical protein
MRWFGGLVMCLLLSCQPSADSFVCPEGEVCEDGEVLVYHQVTGVSIDHIALYQSVKVPLVMDGQKQNSATPVVANKEALLRVFLGRTSDFASREIVGRLTIEIGAEEMVVYEETFLLDSRWTEGDLSSTLNFSIEAAAMTPAATFDIELLEVELGFEGEETMYSPRYPAEGRAEMGAQSTGGPLKVYLLPVRYLADGSGRVPNLSASRVQAFADDLTAMYPASTVEITLLETMDWPYAVDPFGSGWSNLLQEMYYERSRRSVPFEAYLYGIFSPDGSISQFCHGGCVMGLSTLAVSSGDSWARVSIGVGFPGEAAISTFMHELGHAHGRRHTPCQTNDYDTSYPYAGGLLGSWGYDAPSATLINPSQAADFMGYCSPDWVSDYTYGALFDRIQALGNYPDMLWPDGVSRQWQTVFVDGQGGTSLGDVIEADRPPTGRLRDVTLHNRRGEVVGTSQGHFSPYDHLPGGILLVPTLSSDVTLVSL